MIENLTAQARPQLDEPGDETIQHITPVDPDLTPDEETEYQVNRLFAAAIVKRGEEGERYSEIGSSLGISEATVRRWVDRYHDALAGNRRSLLRKHSSGRKTAIGDLSQDAVDRLRRKVLRCGSVALAVQHFADDPLCPDPLRDKILAMPNPHAIPLSLRRACHVTPEMKARHRGPVAYQHIGFKCRHNGTVIDPATDEARDLMAGDIYISDDMSRNRYFWFQLSDPEIETRANRGDKLARKYGVAIGRQGLYTIDAAGKGLGLTLVGCARDAYTSADVLRHMKSTLADHGKPRIGWILEKGCWAAKTVDGHKVWVPDEERSAVVGGMKSLGFLVEHVHTSEGKALIESWFNYLQSIQSLYEGAPDIGRKRGEMEGESKLIARIQQGVMHPAEAGLEHINEALQNDLKAVTYANSREKFGRIQHGVPDERWVKDTNRFQLSQLEPKDMGVFMPVKLETQIRQGCLEKKIGGQIYRFMIPEIFGTLGVGYRLMLCFDDSNPAAGAEVYNLETGSRNTHAWAHMEWIGHAEWENSRPLFGYSDQVAESIGRGKRYHRAFVNAYAGTGIFGKRAMSAIESRDGRGNVTTIERFDHPNDHTPDGDSSRTDRPSHASPVRLPAQRAGVSGLEGKREADPHRREDAGATSQRGRRILNRMDLVDA